MKKLYCGGGDKGLVRVLSYGILLAVLAVLMLFLHLRVDTLLDSDMAAELELASLLASEGRILSPNWYYSTELRVLNTQIFYSFFFHLTQNWHWVRILSDAVMLILMLLCCNYYYRACGYQNAIITAAVLVLPFSRIYFNFVLRGAYYIPHIAITFLSLALMECYLKDKKNRFGYLGAEIVLAVIAGMGGPRQLLVTYLPMLLAAIGIWWCKNEEDDSIKNLFFAAVTFCSSAVGYGINTKILARKYHFQQWDGLNFTNFQLNRLEQVLNGILTSYGYKTGRIFSVGNLASNAAALCCIVGTILAIVYALRKKEKVSKAYYRLAWLTAAAWGCFSILYCFTDFQYTDRYNLPIVVLSVPLITMAVHEVELKKIPKNVVVLGLAGLVLLNGAAVYRRIYKEDNTAELRQIASMLMEQGYEEGYGPFWCTHILTELSDGKIITWCWGDESGKNDNPYRIYRWLQPVERETTHPEGKVFVIIPNSKKENFTWLDKIYEKDIVYKSESYTVAGYNDYGTMLAAIPREEN